MKVSVIKQDNYNLEELKINIKKSLENIIDLNEVFSNNKTVVLKINAVSYMNEDLAYTTNPIFIKAIIEVLKEYPVKIIVGDNPPFKDLKSTLKGNGIYKILTEENVEMLDNVPQVTINNDNPIKYNEFIISKNIYDADIVINVPKIKTHSLTYFSCCEKNLFGLIHGLSKAAWHVKANNPQDFGYMINDLYCAFKPHFKENHFINLVDAVDGLEGDGPTTGGIKKHLGYILASTSSVACDVVGLKVSNLELDKSYITTTAINTHIDISNIDEIEIIGDTSYNTSLKAPEKTLKSLKILETQIMKNLLLEHPKIDTTKCIKCGSCAKICPPQTMKITNGEFPHLNPNKCIRCWCCSEVCPKDAIYKSKRPLLGRIIIK